MSEPRFNSRAEIQAHQLERLRALIAAVQHDNPFWAHRLRAAGVDASVESLEAFADRMPLLTKAELSADQDAHPPHGTNLTFARNRYTRLHQTSSTTGRPLRWLDAPEDWQWLMGGWEAVYDAAGVRAGDCAFFAFSFGPFIGFWLAWDAALARGCRCIPGGAMNTATRLRAILANEVTVLCCTPTYAIRLGEAAREEGLDLSQSTLRVLIVAGEPGGSVPAVRSRLERLWPTARIVDHHGMTEVGAVTYECPDQRGTLHVVESMYLCEIVDPRQTGAEAQRRPGFDAPATASHSNLRLPPQATAASPKPQAPIEGELVITTLGRAGSPVLRYRTGDIVRADVGPCECGRATMRFIGGIIGRCDDMVVVRGTNLYPSALDAILGQFTEIVEYRVEVGRRAGMVELRLLIEPAAGVNNPRALCERVEQAIRDAWNLRVPVRAASPGELPRFELKARRWVHLDE